MPNPQTNIVQFGVSKLAYALITAETDAGVPTYGTPVMLPGAREMNLAPQGERRVLSADNVEYYVVVTNNGYEGDVTLAMIPDHFRIACLGEKQDAATDSNVTYEAANVPAQRFALLGLFGGDFKNIGFVLYNCTASRPTIAAQTLDGTTGLDPTSISEAFSITARPRRDNNMVRAKLVDDGSETFANWFSAVYTPTVAS